MDDVEAHVAGARVAHHRVEVGAVVVERPPRLVDQAGDLGDVLVEEAERVGVGQHQAGDLVGVLVDLRPQVVHLHPAALVRRDLDHLVAGHRHRGRVGPVRGVGSQHLGPGFAAVGVEGAGQQQAGELAVGAGGGLQADVGQAADLPQRPLQQPHQLQRPLGPARVLGRVQAGVAGQRRDPLVQPRVVLHRAGAERVEAAVEIEVAARELVVVADDLRLGDLRQRRRLGPQQVGRDQLLQRRLRDAGVREHGGAPARLRLLVDRLRAFALHRRLNQFRPRALLSLVRAHHHRRSRSLASASAAGGLTVIRPPPSHARRRSRRRLPRPARRSALACGAR